MVNHVKLEIAIQIVAEKISDLYKLRDEATTEEEINNYNNKLALAFEARDKVALGDLTVINKILNSGANDNG